jgi:hypothetical protein
MNSSSYVEDYQTIYNSSDINTNIRQKEHNIGAQYFNLDLYNGSLFTFNTTFKKNINYTVTNSVNLYNYNIQNYINAPGQNQWINNFTLEKRISKTGLKIRLFGTWLKTFGYTYIVNKENKSNSDQYSVKLTLLNNNKEGIFNYQTGLELRGTSTYYSLFPTKNYSTVYKPFLNMEFRYSPKVILYINNVYEIYKAVNAETKFYNLGFKLNYKINSKWLIWTQINDLLNLNSSIYTTSNTSNNIFETNTYNRMPGFAGGGVRYTL